jgi:hypothetical protein
LGHCYSVPISFAWCSSSLGHWFFVPLALLDTPPHWLIVYFIFFQLALHDANLRDGSRPFLGLVKHSKKIPSASGGYPISIISLLEKRGCYHAYSWRVGWKLCLFIIRSPSHAYGVGVRTLAPSSSALWSTYV